MSTKIPIAIFASGRGSNFEAIHAAILEKKLDAEIVGVFSDNEDALVLEKARACGIKAISIPFPSANSNQFRNITERRLAHEEKILSELAVLKPRFLVMAGYMRVLTPGFIERFRSERGYTRIVNIHPSILPAFSGMAGYAQAFQYGVKIAGVSIHLVEPEVDGGPICAQEAFSIADCISEADVEKRGLAVEHRLYPAALAWVLPEKFSVEKRVGGRLCVFKN